LHPDVAAPTNGRIATIGKIEEAAENVPIDLPRSRARASAKFVMLKETILARVMEVTTVQHLQLKHVP
jgi:hypothetical protein